MIKGIVKNGLLLGILITSPGEAWGQLWKGQAGDINELERKARQGDAEAMAEYAWHLIEGVGGRRYVPKEIREWFGTAAENGNPLGKAGLSRCLVQGIGGPVDFAKAWSLAEEAADAGHPEGWKQKAILLHRGTGTAKDAALSLELTRKASNAGSVAATCNLRVKTRSGDYLGHAELALETGHMLSIRNALYGYSNMKLMPETFEIAGKLIDRAEEGAALDHPIALLALAFVRSNQGDSDASAALKVRALMTGVEDGYDQILGELSRAASRDWKSDHFLRPIDHRRLEWWGIQHGVRGAWLAARVSETLLEPLGERKPDPKLAVDLLRRELPDPKKGIHLRLARQFMRQTNLFDQSEIPAELAVAHAIYSSDLHPYSVGLTSVLLSGRQRGVEPELAKAYAAARRPESREHWNDRQMEELKNQLDEEQLKLSDELLAGNFPTAGKFIEEARKILEAAGDWKPPQG